MNDLIKKVEKFVSNLYKNELDDRYTFHNLAHAKRTVKAVNQLAEYAGLNQEDLLVLNLAAWFHDTGLSKSYQNHEQKSAEIARIFLQENKCKPDKIEKVTACILATKLNRKPTNLLEEIIRDADIIHLGKKSFFKRNKALRNEWEKVLNNTYSDQQWLESDLKFFEDHQFFTEFARSEFNDQRILNQSTIQANLEALKKGNVNLPLPKKIKPQRTPDRGIETMFRLTSKNHFTLSSIADSKASTLISISALIISIILSVLVSRLSEDPHLILPTVLILITLMGTIIFAVISTRPKVTSFKLSREDVTQKKGNLLFFGNFINMQVEDYEWGMKEVMNDRDYLYNNLIRDIYYLGVVLGKKYKYLRVAYNFFMYGLIISVVSYIIAFAL